MNTKQVALIVLDGWGYRPDSKDNAVVEAHTPFFDKLWNEYPHALLDASGESIGLPKGQIGNSEVGHMTIGAGRIIETDFVRITNAMNAGEFLTNPVMKTLFDHVKKYDSTLHLMGLVSSGGIHSHEMHLHEILRVAKQSGVKKVYIHAFTDGRDVAPQSAVESLQELEGLCTELGTGCVATLSGRLYAMDRDQNWNRIEKVQQAIFHGQGNVEKGKKASEVMTEAYQSGIIDEHMEPVVLLDEAGQIPKLFTNDGILFFNFRSDRARQLSKLIANVKTEKNICFVTLTEYDKNLDALVVFGPNTIDTTIASVVSGAGLTQVHIAETEKYPHATYFLNGGREEPHKAERHILVESRRDVLTHDLAPEMRAREIADEAVAQINNGVDFIFINFANADMVGHTANRPAIIKAVETVDRELARVVEALEARGGVALITSDHGNAEMNVDPDTGGKHTAHTLNVVPVIITQKGLKLSDGTLADVAPTVLNLLGLVVPPVMTGKKLLYN